MGKAHAPRLGNPLDNGSFLSDHHELILRYHQGIMSGYINYYSFVDNYGMLKRVAYIVRFSAAGTLKRKFEMLPVASVFKGGGTDGGKEL